MKKKSVVKSDGVRYTAGPWSANRALVAAAPEGKLKGAVICYAVGDTVGESEANARLIAAAPEMFEALKALYTQPLAALTTAEVSIIKVSIEKLITKVEGK